MIRVQLEVPADADADVLKALRAVGAALPKASVQETFTAPENTYGLTVHVLPDEKEE